MAIVYFPFTPNINSPFQFQPVLDGNTYSAVVTWNFYAQRYYSNLYALDGTLVFALPVAGSQNWTDVQLTTVYQSQFATVAPTSGLTFLVTQAGDYMVTENGSAYLVTISLGSPLRFAVENGAHLISTLVPDGTTVTVPGANVIAMSSGALATGVDVDALLNNDVNLAEGYFLQNALVYRQAAARFEVYDIVTPTPLPGQNTFISEGFPSSFVSPFPAPPPPSLQNWVWTIAPVPGNTEGWKALAMSADGMTIIVGPGSANALYWTTDGGNTWTALYPQGSLATQFTAAAMSADGSQVLTTNVSNLNFTPSPTFDIGSAGLNLGMVGSSYDYFTGGTITASGVGYSVFDIRTLNPVGGTQLEPVIIQVMSINGFTGVAGFQILSSGQFTVDPTGFTEAGGLVLGSPTFVSTVWHWTFPFPDTGPGPPYSTGTADYSLEFAGGGSCVAMSTDGSRMVAASLVPGSPTYNNFANIFVSLDSGVNWSPQLGLPSGSERWVVAMTPDGNTIIAADSVTRNLYVGIYSFGQYTWALSAGSLTWYGVAVSADGTKIAAVANDGNAYISVGGLWNSVVVGSAISLIGVSMDAAGDVVMVADNAGGIWVSQNGGATWTEQPVPQDSSWWNVVVSSDGKRAAAIDNAGQPWVGVYEIL